MHFVLFVNGLVFVFFGALMALVGLFWPETRQPFLEASLLCGLLGAVASVASSARLSEMRRIHAFALTTTVWLSSAVAGAAPLHLWGMSPADAFFESMSGITTTGSTVMSGLDLTPRSIILWRALLQGIGGVGFIVTAIALLPILKVGGMQLFRTESSDQGEKELRNAAMFAGATLQVYLALMAICAVAYRAGGMNTFDALTHAMTTLSTGGYSGYDASFGHFQSPFLQWSGTLFMLLGALPFSWYIRVMRGKGARSDQVEAMVITLVVTIGGLAVWVWLSNGTEFLVALRQVAFNVVSVVTTTGYATTDYLLWGPFAAAAFFVLTAVGGCTGSTAGGAKAMRWLLIFRVVRQRIQQMRSPHGIFFVRYEGRRVDEDVLGGVISFFIFYVATLAFLTIALTFYGLDVATASSGALTALANVGPGVGSIIGPSGNFAGMTDAVKVILSFGMFVGRLEMATVFMLLTPVFWREAGVVR